MSTPDLRRRVVPADVLAWFLFDEDLCTAVGETSPASLEVTLTGAEIRPTTRSFPLGPEIASGLARACADRNY